MLFFWGGGEGGGHFMEIAYIMQVFSLKNKCCFCLWFTNHRPPLPYMYLFDWAQRYQLSQQFHPKEVAWAGTGRCWAAAQSTFRICPSYTHFPLPPVCSSRLIFGVKFLYDYWLKERDAKLIQILLNPCLHAGHVSFKAQKGLVFQVVDILFLCGSWARARQQGRVQVFLVPVLHLQKSEQLLKIIIWTTLAKTVANTLYSPLKNIQKRTLG